MTDKPILFSAPMVRALLDGRKTQTRRVLKLSPPTDADAVFYWPREGRAKVIERHGPNCAEEGIWARRAGTNEDDPTTHVSDGYIRFLGRSKFEIGDRLWVKETHAPLSSGSYIFKATAPDLPDVKWKPSIFMPRKASRITLRVLNVRVQRLHDISEGDAFAEGVARIEGKAPILGYSDWSGPIYGHPMTSTYIEAYARLWDEINGPGAWKANPWVAAYSFTVERQNIDKVAP